MLALLLSETESRGDRICVTLAPPDDASIRLTQCNRRPNESRKHGLQIESRAADDLEHVGGGGLLLQRFGQITSARLHLIKQACVLNRDHSLVCESRHELDLLLSKWVHLIAGEHKNADRRPLTQKRHTEARS